MTSGEWGGAQRLSPLSVRLCRSLSARGSGDVIRRNGEKIDFIHDGLRVGFAIIMQISYTLLRGQTTQLREIITNRLAK